MENLENFARAFVKIREVTNKNYAFSFRFLGCERAGSADQGDRRGGIRMNQRRYLLRGEAFH